jgi:hypothetical protein
MSEHEFELEYLKQQEERLLREGRAVLSQAEALQLESRLLVSRALRLLCQQLSHSATESVS